MDAFKFLEQHFEGLSSSCKILSSTMVRIIREDANATPEMKQWAERLLIQSILDKNASILQELREHLGIDNQSGSEESDRLLYERLTNGTSESNCLLKGGQEGKSRHREVSKLDTYNPKQAATDFVRNR